MKHGAFHVARHIARVAHVEHELHNVFVPQKLQVGAISDAMGQSLQDPQHLSVVVVVFRRFVAADREHDGVEERDLELFEHGCGQNVPHNPIVEEMARVGENAGHTSDNVPHQGRLVVGHTQRVQNRRNVHLENALVLEVCLQRINVLQHSVQKNLGDVPDFGVGKRSHNKPKQPGIGQLRHVECDFPLLFFANKLVIVDDDENKKLCVVNGFSVSRNRT
ncbi:hypothetical protein CLUG_05692 [Clavispora lusitaniae ATCC 42720]|uniref:Uncharacterized protein n=1 Tax=Clavispora lusitaniae (strain ATCC 42720) TaxID=306902 RepID=C4YBW4_CLAL4|nr:uncharacterized protein CLUG_05692 [Clavispora lusitaniae ATCC 42720]EEQ41563.1 hypothetical protein CLUG_05692 [Clavispora lusitaniae ATCC 42720]